MKAKLSNTENVNAKLNSLLADLQIVYQNLRTQHWLVKGPEFFQLHKIYEDFYTETAETVDEVAERILMLGGVPLHTYSAYLAEAKITPVTEVPAGKASLKTVIENQEHLLASYREVLSEAATINDEGTVSLMSELIASTEKKLWMLNATIA